MKGFDKKKITRFTEALSVDNIEVMLTGLSKDLEKVLPYVEIKRPPIKTGTIYIMLSSKAQSDWQNQTFQNSPYMSLSLSEIGGGRFKLEILNMATSLIYLNLCGVNGSSKMVRARLLDISERIKNQE
jgi:hypothetical protein